MRRRAVLAALAATVLLVAAVGVWKRGPIERRVDAFLHPDERSQATGSPVSSAPVPDLEGAEEGGAIGMQVRVLRSGRDFEASSLVSPDGPETQFGYSVSCPVRPVARDEPALAISSYLADDERGRVHVAPQRALEGRLSGDTLRSELLTIGVDMDPPAWFGHEVALADVTGDGSPDLLSGARYAYGQLGSSWYVDGRRLRDRLGRNGKWTLSHDDAVEYRTEGLTAPKEMGFSVALVPGRGARGRGTLAMRAANSRGGQLEGGALALVGPPSAPGKRALRLPDFAAIDPQAGADFGGVLDVTSSGELLTGGWANPQFFKLPYVAPRVWQVPLDRSAPKELFSLATAWSDPVSRQLSPDRLRTPQGTHLVVGATKPFSGALDPSGVFVIRARDGLPVFFTAPELQGVSFPFSVDSGHDLDGDGVNEIVGSAAGWAPRAKRTKAEGAVVVINGGDIARATETLGGRVRAAVLEWDAPGDNTGSKRRLCIQDQPRQKRTLLVAGAPYGPGGVVMAAIRRDTLWR